MKQLLRMTALGLVFSLTACGTTNAKFSPTVNGVITITQADLDTAEVPAARTASSGTGTSLDGKTVAIANSSRTVSVASGAAEIIVALGLTKNLVGRDIASETTALANVPVVTDAHSLSAEKVLATKPTLLIIDDQTAPTEAIDAVAKAGVQVITIPEAWSVEDIAPRVTNIATIFGVTDAATDVIKAMKFNKYPMTDTKVGFLYLRGTSSIYLLGGVGSGADSLINAAGAHDIGADAKLGPFTPLTPEALISAQPDVLLVMTKGLESVGGIDGLLGLPGVKQTPAGQHRRVVAVDDGVLLAFGTDTPKMIDLLASAFAQAMQDSAK